MSALIAPSVRAVVGPIGEVDALIRAVEELEAYGVEIPKSFRAICDAWRTVRFDAGDALRKLVEAVAAGRTKDIPSLLMASAVARDADVAAVRNAIARPVKAALLEAWHSDGAYPAYEKIAAEYNSEAQKLAVCAAIVDIEASAESLVAGRLTAEQQEAWLAAREYAARLNELAVQLAAAAALLPGGPDLTSGDSLLPLVCNPGILHRRRVWETWDSKGACGRWGTMLSLGVKLRAHPNPAEMTPYERPAPFESKMTKTRKGGVTGYEQYKIDPEDALYEERRTAAEDHDANN